MAADNLRLARAQQIPLLQLYGQFSEPELLEITRQGLQNFLLAALDDDPFPRASASIDRWKAGALPVPKEQIKISDIVLAYSVRKLLFLQYLPQYTQDITVFSNIVQELEQFYTRLEQYAFETFVDMQNEALRREKELIETILNTTEEGISAVDTNGQIILWNQALVTRTGVARETIIGKPVFDFFPKNAQSVEVDAIRQAQQGEKVHLENVPIKSRAGFYDMDVVPLRNTAGQIIGSLTVSRDVTEKTNALQELHAAHEELTAQHEELASANEELQSAQEQLRQNNSELEDRVIERTAQLEEQRAALAARENFLASIIDQTPVSTWIANAEGTQIQVNQACLDLFGVTDPSAGIGKYNVLKDDTLTGQPFYPDIVAVFREGKVARFSGFYDLSNVRHVNIPTGKSVWLNVTIFPVKDAAGKVTNAVVQHENVTERIKAEQALRTSEEQLRLITDALPVLISYLDEQLVYRFVNQAYLDWFGGNRTDIVDKPAREVLAKKVFETARKWMQQALSGEEVRYETRVNYKQVGIKDVLVQYIPHVRNEKVVGFYALISDISSIKQYQEALLTQNNQLTRINTDLDNFVYTASHDLKSPVGNLEGLLLVLNKTIQPKLDEREQKIFGMMAGSITKLKNTISALIDVTKVAKNVEDATETVSIPEVVQDVKADLVNLIEEFQPNFSEDYAVEQIQSVRINVRSIMYNLLSNAIKYRSPDRPLYIALRTYVEAGFVVISLQDNGLGMQPEQLEKLFTMFKRMHTHVEGTGIGLYILKRIVENTGGRVVAESQLDRGSTFKVYLPE